MASYEITKNRWGEEELEIYDNYRELILVIPIEEIVRDIIRKFSKEQEPDETN